MKRQGQWLELIIPEEWEQKSIESILRDTWQAPKGLLHRLRMEKGVILNGSPCNWNTRMDAGSKLHLKLFWDEEYGVIPEYELLDVLFEDDHLLIVNKPAGMDTHPTDKGQTGTLANRVAAYLQGQGTQSKIRHIHRLDRDTSGAVVFAKHALASAIMDRMLAKRLISRNYTAFAHGELRQTKGSISAPIGRDRHHSTRRRVSDKGDKAITHFLVKERYSEATRLQLSLETGRTHQIRVHMSYIGHPLIGDTLYGGKKEGINRQALHAEWVRLTHPFGNEQIQVEAPLPKDLLELNEKLRRG
jgi:23S rRNA pseudouridine1911/1915/1917 synthase